MDSIPNSKSASEVIILDDLSRDEPLTVEQREHLKSWWMRSMLDRARLQP